jgi:fimbrial isopeptide formation D2 family protein
MAHKAHWGRLRGVVAATLSAATLLAVGAAGVGTAYADSNVLTSGSTGKISIAGVPTGPYHTFKAVKLARYVAAISNGSSSTDLSSVGVETVNNASLKAKLVNAAIKVNGSSLSGATGWDANDPMKWVVSTRNTDDGNFTSSLGSSLRDFVTALSQGVAAGTPGVSTATTPVDFNGADGTVSTATNNEFTGLEPGIYMIVDTTVPTGNQASGSIPIMVGTTVDSYVTLATKPLGSINIKNQNTSANGGNSNNNPNNPGDDSNSGNGLISKKAVKVGSDAVASNTVEASENAVADAKAKSGDTITFEVQGKMPSTTGYSNFTYQINDTWNEGLEFDNTLTPTVKIDNGSAISLGTDAADINYATTTVGGKITKVTFNVPFSKLDQTKVGKPMVFTYRMKVVNTDGDWKHQDNTAELTYTNSTSGSTGTATAKFRVALYSLTIQSKDKNSSAVLTDAKYQVNVAGGSTLNFKRLTAAGHYQYDPNGTVTELEADSATNTIVIDGLPADTYDVKQSALQSGYLKSTLKNVYIGKNVPGVVDPTPGASSDYFKNDADSLGLTEANTIRQDGTNHYNGIVDILNTNSLLGLPLTGGAGLVLLATLIVISGAIAGGTALVRRRTAKRR